MKNPPSMDDLSTMHEDIKTLLDRTARIEVKVENIEVQTIKTNGRVNKAEEDIEELKQINSVKQGGSDTWEKVAKAAGAVFLLLLGSALTFWLR